MIGGCTIRAPGVKSILTLGGCEIFETVLSTAATYEVRVVVLIPAFSGVDHVSESYNTGNCTGGGLEQRSVSSPELRDWRDRGGAEVVGELTGYSADFSPGADPSPCNLWAFHNFQAMTIFNLDELPDGAIVTDARLRSCLERRMTAPDDFVSGTNCAYEFGAAETGVIDAYSHAVGRDARIPYTATRPGAAPYNREMDVTRTVAGWVAGRSENRGFVLSPRDGIAFVEHDDPANVARVYCASYLSDVSLHVAVEAPPGS